MFVLAIKRTRKRTNIYELINEKHYGTVILFDDLSHPLMIPQISSGFKKGFYYTITDVTFLNIKIYD